jgi:hypothetical protein
MRHSVLPVTCIHLIRFRNYTVDKYAKHRWLTFFRRQNVQSAAKPFYFTAPPNFSNRFVVMSCSIYSANTYPRSIEPYCAHIWSRVPTARISKRFQRTPAQLILLTREQRNHSYIRCMYNSNSLIILNYYTHTHTHTHKVLRVLFKHSNIVRSLHNRPNTGRVN